MPYVKGLTVQLASLRHLQLTGSAPLLGLGDSTALGRLPRCPPGVVTPRLEGASCNKPNQTASVPILSISQATDTGETGEEGSWGTAGSGSYRTWVVAFAEGK